MRQPFSADTRRRLPGFALVLLNILLLPHAAQADVGDALDAAVWLVGILSLVWLVPVLFVLRRYRFEPQLLGLFMGGVAGFATGLFSFLFCVHMGVAAVLPAFAVGSMIGGFIAHRAARAWNAWLDRKEAARAERRSV